MRMFFSESVINLMYIKTYELSRHLSGVCTCTYLYYLYLYL